MDDTIIHFSIYPPRTLLEAFKAIAKEHNRSTNSEILMLMKEHIKREEKSKQAKN
jgi:hypothetical protein